MARTRVRKRPARTLETEQQASFGHTLLAAARHFDGLGQQRLNELLGEDLARPAVMRLIPHVTRAGIRPTELAKLADVTKQAVGQTLARLEERGLVEFAPDPSDGRALLVRMTAAGEASSRAGLAALAEVQRELESRVGRDVVRAAFDALRSIAAELESMADNASAADVSDPEPAATRREAGARATNPKRVRPAGGGRRRARGPRS